MLDKGKDRQGEIHRYNIKKETVNASLVQLENQIDEELGIESDPLGKTTEDNWWNPLKWKEVPHKMIVFKI